MNLRFWEKFKGFWATTPVHKQRELYPGQLSWTQRCKYYDAIYEVHPNAKAALLTISGQVMAEGVFTQIPKLTATHESRAEDAKEAIDQLIDDIGLEIMLHETVLPMVKYGSCFWEKTTEPTFDVRVLPNMDLLEPATQDDIGNVTSWRQRTYTQPNPTWNSNELIHYPWNTTPKSWPYGTSLLVGCEPEFKALEKLEKDIAEHMHRVAFPEAMIGVGNDKFMPTPSQIDEVKADVDNWQPGEKHVTSFPVTQMVIGGGQKTIADLDSVLAFFTNNISDALMTPTINKLYNSTFASSKEMTTWTLANLIRPIQRIIARKIEQELFKPYLESLGFSHRLCPHLQFEPPDKNKLEEAEYYATLVGSTIMPADYAAEELGLDMERINAYRKEQLKRQIERQQALPQKPQPNGEGQLKEPQKPTFIKEQVEIKQR